MDDLRFDHFVQTLAQSGSRRRFLAGIASGALGVAGLQRAKARACSAPETVCREHATCCSGVCGAKDRTGRRRCACGKPADCPISDACHIATCGDGVCGVEEIVDFSTDERNCGRCGRVCAPDPNGAVTCAAGACSVACNKGYFASNGTCVPLLPFGAACTASAECLGGACACASKDCATTLICGVLTTIETCVSSPVVTPEGHKDVCVYSAIGADCRTVACPSVEGRPGACAVNGASCVTLIDP